MATSSLCDTCNELDFHKLAHRPRYPDEPNCSHHYQDRLDSFDRSGSFSNSSYSAELGSVAEVLSRAENCALCRLITQSLAEWNGPQCPRDKCSTTSITFCGMARKDRLKKYTDRMAIILSPVSSTGQLGPHLPQDEAEKSLTEAKVILELQACPKDIPTVANAFMAGADTHTFAWDGDFGSSDCVNPTVDPDKLNHFSLPAGFGLSNSNAIDGADTQHFATHHNTLNDPRFSGRLVDETKVDLGLVKKWLRLCERSHGLDCTRLALAKAKIQTDGLLVIDVHRACIVDAPPNCRYATLSYCWGSTTMLRHTQANSADLKAEGSLNKANTPATVSDAMLLVGGLGERYLWVDALCIIQDNPLHSQIQISQMGAIYTNALLTIIAATGEDANAGLPGVTPGTRNVKQGVIHLPDMSLITAIDGPYYPGVPGSKWVTRAWTMQEKLLSQRRLIFTEQQVYWQCQCATWLEEMVLENTGPLEFAKVPGSGGAHDIDIFGSSYSEYRVYEELVIAYVRRQLTYQSDTLHAFTGITDALEELYKGEKFIWALPESRFNWALSWELEGRERNRASSSIVLKDGTTMKIPFPSWSWTAWAGTGGREDLRWIKWSDPGDCNSFVDPEIEFYREDIHGRVQKVHDLDVSLNATNKNLTDWSRLYDWQLSTVRNQWKGFDRDASNGRWRDKEIKDEMQTVPLGEDFIDSGRLCFWTSVTPFWLYRSYRKGTRGHIYTAISASESSKPFRDIRLNMESTTHLPWRPRAAPGAMARTHPRQNHPNQDTAINTTKYNYLEIGGSSRSSNPNHDIDNVVMVNGESNLKDAEFRNELERVTHDEDIDETDDGQETEAVRLDFVIIGRSIQEPKRFLRALIVEWVDGIAYRVGCASVAEKEWVEEERREWKMIRLGQGTLTLSSCLW
jgi:hypothetical protein